EGCDPGGLFVSLNSGGGDLPDLLGHGRISGAEHKRKRTLVRWSPLAVHLLLDPGPVWVWFDHQHPLFAPGVKWILAPIVSPVEVEGSCFAFLHHREASWMEL